MDDDESSVNNNDDASVASCGLTKNDVIKLLFIRDKSLSLVQPEKFKSLIWERFRCIYYRGEFHSRGTRTSIQLQKISTRFKVSDL